MCSTGTKYGAPQRLGRLPAPSSEGPAPCWSLATAGPPNRGGVDVPHHMGIGPRAVIRPAVRGSPPGPEASRYRASRSATAEETSVGNPSRCSRCRSLPRRGSWQPVGVRSATRGAGDRSHPRTTTPCIRSPRNQRRHRGPPHRRPATCRSTRCPAFRCSRQPASDAPSRGAPQRAGAVVLARSCRSASPCRASGDRAGLCRRHA